VSVDAPIGGLRLHAQPTLRGYPKNFPMSLERAQALIIRGYDFSETSRIAVMWTREFGKVGAMAKGGRRLKSAFESSLDLLNVCDIVLIRKASGTLDLLTEARVCERFPRLRHNLAAWYAGQYVAELLGDWTQDHDPHPVLFDEAIETLRDLDGRAAGPGPRLARFELVLLRELGYGPALEHCAACNAVVAERSTAFSPARGGVLCPQCQPLERDRIPLGRDALEWMLRLRQDNVAWRELADMDVRKTIRRILGDYVTYVRGRRPRLLPYLGS
jgi:DNA repair protein RecO (recombination protein O)